MKFKLGDWVIHKTMKPESHCEKTNNAKKVIYKIDGNRAFYAYEDGVLRDSLLANLIHYDTSKNMETIKEFLEIKES